MTRAIGPVRCPGGHGDSQRAAVHVTAPERTAVPGTRRCSLWSEFSEPTSRESATTSTTGGARSPVSARMSTLHQEDRGRVSAEWDECAREGKVFRSEYRFLRPDGVSSWVYGQVVSESG
jgi:hypothetical protein